jgi:glutamine amidotransferase-like uncharacterized protein
MLARILFLALLLLEASVHAAPEKPLALIFRGPTICDGCETVLQTVMEKRGYETRYVGVGETTPALLATADVYLVGGGEDVQDLAHGWSESERQALRAWIHAGGRYFGACLGAYWASNWGGEMPGFVSLDIVPFTVWAHDKDKSDKILPVLWGGKSRYVYFQDGPAFAASPERPGRDAKVYATYFGGSVAAFLSRFGQGKVAVTGVHVEADQSWYDDANLVDPDGLDDDLFQEMLDDLLR